ncbi:hypothetical protein HPB47_016858 [Ixodes persulcatus]|uniref:Uncharacterized protein n=1 Tax=Ixodes persulcatus TaxID=34615 RepID=A0AC60QPX5_IXOPE|nr:hypothetical protein HPB47_016858 [Ixodes persulcatus]
MLEIDGGMNGHSEEEHLILNFNVDGLPLGKSSRNQFWPILCEVRNVQNVAPFLVGLFYGQSKPPDVNEFLHDFVQELSELLQEGVNQLAAVGGSSVGNNTRGVLEQLMTQKVAVEFSWLGQREKMKSKDLEYPDVIYRRCIFSGFLCCQAPQSKRKAAFRVLGPFKNATQIYDMLWQRSVAAFCTLTRYCIRCAHTVCVQKECVKSYFRSI